MSDNENKGGGDGSGIQLVLPGGQMMMRWPVQDLHVDRYVPGHPPTVGTDIQVTHIQSRDDINQLASIKLMMGMLEELTAMRVNLHNFMQLQIQKQLELQHMLSDLQKQVRSQQAHNNHHKSG